MKVKTAIILFFFLCIGAVLLGAFALATAAEVESVRDSQYEWTCEDAAGNVISGHTRQDKAFQSCYNAALASGEVFYVRGGSFRVTATGTETQPPEPPIDPDPPPDPPPPDPASKPQVTFGPVSALTEYPATIGALKQNTFRWEVTFTLNSLPATGRMGLASRDQSGTKQVGHLSLWVEAGQLTLRHQDACVNCGGSGEEFRLTAGPIVAGTEYVAVVSMSNSEGTSLWLDGELQASDPRSWGLDKNSLPLIVGGLCSSCDPNAVPPKGPASPIDGTVYMEIWDDALPLPQPVAVELRWQNPTQYVDGTSIGPGELTEIRLYRDGVMLAGVDPDVAVYEVTGLVPGNTYCFEATAVAIEESERSNQICRSP
jgi:hypothetical protein